MALQHPTEPLLTDKELAQCPFPDLPLRMSQRKSRSRTRAVNARTFEDLQEWPGFLTAAAVVSSRLDNSIKRNGNPWHIWRDGLEPASEESTIRGTLEQILFPQVNYLAGRLGLQMRYKSGGSGRSFSFTDMVIVDITQAQQLSDLSARVFGNGEGKGYWQWELGILSFTEALNSSSKQKMCIEVVQQLFGDMILDESVAGFVSNYNETVFFYRSSGRTKSLFYSPVVRINDAPIEKFLYVLDFVEMNQNWKSLMSRTLVQEPPRNGYMLQLPQVPYTTRSGRANKRIAQTIQVKAQRVKRKVAVANRAVEFYNEDRLCHIPAYPLDYIGVTGKIHGLGKYGNILQAQFQNENLALKTFDLRREAALPAFLKEQEAYHHLQSMQGIYIPSLILVGRLPHTSVLYLGLTNEARGPPTKDLFRGKRGKVMGQAMLHALDQIHYAGVLHGDLSLSNVLFSNGTPKFIDFEYSVIHASQEDLNAETSEMEELVLGKLSGDV